MILNSEEMLQLYLTLKLMFGDGANVESEAIYLVNEDSVTCFYSAESVECESPIGSSPIILRVGGDLSLHDDFGLDYIIESIACNKDSAVIGLMPKAGDGEVEYIVVPVNLESQMQEDLKHKFGDNSVDPFETKKSAIAMICAFDHIDHLEFEPVIQQGGGVARLVMVGSVGDVDLDVETFSKPT